MNKSIFQLVKESGNKRIVVTNEAWKNGYSIVNRVEFGESSKAYGVTHHSNGWTRAGEIKGAEKSCWLLIEVINDDILIDERK